MISTQKLREYQAVFKGNGISEFIDFVDAELLKNKKSGIISLEMREAAGKAKELKRLQEDRKPISPEEDFKNLK